MTKPSPIARRGHSVAPSFFRAETPAHTRTGLCSFTRAPVPGSFLPQRVKARFSDKSAAPRKASSWHTGVVPGTSRTPRERSGSCFSSVPNFLSLHIYDPGTPCTLPCQTGRCRSSAPTVSHSTPPCFASTTDIPHTSLPCICRR